RGNPNDTAAANHEDLRILWTNTALALTQAPQNVAPEPAPTTPSLKPLQAGSRGERVRELQLDLEALGIATGGADGIFGQGTKRAVVAFQQENGIPITGIADAATITAIDLAAADPARTRAATLDRDRAPIFGPPGT
ncbi:peptidoglycan-binding protein, partial [Hyphomonas sp.]|uniref:peptidoglycan-binding protein n=1 Tax=Hyphomonas sp. TaxID=87 RepID=UPI0037C0B05F